MNRNQFASRSQSTFSIAAGDKATFYGPCDYWSIFSIANAGGIAQEISMAMNETNNFAKVRAGAGFQGRVGAGETQILVFHNTTGATVTVTLTHGNGQGIPGTVYVNSGEFDLSAATIAALVDGIVGGITAAVVMEPIAEGISVTTTYTGAKALFVENTHATLDLTISWGGGTYDLAPGENVEWTCETDHNNFVPITVTLQVGGTAIVSGTRLA